MQMIYHFLYHCKPYYALHIILCIVLPYGYIHTFYNKWSGNDYIYYYCIIVLFICILTKHISYHIHYLSWMCYLCMVNVFWTVPSSFPMKVLSTRWLFLYQTTRGAGSPRHILHWETVQSSSSSSLWMLYQKWHLIQSSWSLKLVSWRKEKICDLPSIVDFIC